MSHMNAVCSYHTPDGLKPPETHQLLKMLQPKSQPLSAPPDSRSRSPYVVKACEECRRRKIRCNGVQPCRRCARLSLVCFYRAKRQHNSHPEQSLDLHNILTELNNLRADYEALVNNSRHGSSASGSPQPVHRSHGSTSYGDPVLLEDVRLSDPLTELSSDEVHRLIHVYDKRAQFIYPLADLDAVRSSAVALDQHRSWAYPEEALEEADAACLKLLLSVAMVIDDQCHGGLPARLYESTEAYVLGLSIADGLDVKALRVFVLVVRRRALLLPCHKLLSLTSVLGAVLLRARQDHSCLAQHRTRSSGSGRVRVELAAESRRVVPAPSTAQVDPGARLVNIRSGLLLESAHGIQTGGRRSGSEDGP